MTDSPFAVAPSSISFLDTDILIEVERGDSATVAWFQTATNRIVITGVSAMEFIQGSRDKPELRRRLRFIASFVIVWTSAQEMKTAHDMLVQHCLSGGLRMGDALIAATVQECHAPLYTRNRKHYKPLNLQMPAF